MKNTYTPNDFKHLASDAKMIQAAVDTAAQEGVSAVIPRFNERTERPLAAIASSTVSRGGTTEKSRRSAVRVYAPLVPINGRAITRPTACSPTSSSRATRQIAYNSSSGTTSVCAAIWNTLSADVYTITLPLAQCSSP